MEDLGWSDGVDNRILINSANFGNGSPYSHIGTTAGTGGICTATLIGPSSPGRFALTAAHCVTTASGWSNYPIMIPRQDGTATPFGTWQVNWMMVPSQRFTQGCNVDAANGDADLSCISHDIALMQVVPSGVGGDPGWMNFNALSIVGGSHLAASVSKRVYGYPGCPPIPGAPSSCPSGGGYLYGQPTSHTLGTWGATQNGYYRRAKYSADTSKGMSGSALFTTDSNGGPPFVAFGVDSATSCQGAACAGTARPNWTRLIDWDWGTLMYAYMNP
jgi:hypothetical protein